MRRRWRTRRRGSRKRRRREGRSVTVLTHDFASRSSSPPLKLAEPQRVVGALAKLLRTAGRFRPLRATARERQRQQRGACRDLSRCSPAEVGSRWVANSRQAAAFFSCTEWPCPLCFHSLGSRTLSADVSGRVIGHRNRHERMISTCVASPLCQCKVFRAPLDFLAIFHTVHTQP